MGFPLIQPQSANSFLPAMRRITQTIPPKASLAQSATLPAPITRNVSRHEAVDSGAERSRVASLLKFS